MQSKPLIRWAGSKRKILPLLIDNMPAAYDRYIEPFCGSASLFFELPPTPAVLSDINPELINAFRVIKEDPNIRKKLIAIESTKDEYYRIRAIDPNSLDNTERAVRFLFLNRYCFNGVYRTNQQGHFNVPMGTRTGDFPSEVVFEEARKRLEDVELRTSDYNQTLSSLRKGDFVYIDPPYSKAGKSVGEYGVGSFNSSDIPGFMKKLKKIDETGVKFLFSYSACEETIKALSNDYDVKIISVKRHISGFKKNWITASEILVKNYG